MAEKSADEYARGLRERATHIQRQYRICALTTATIILLTLAWFLILSLYGSKLSSGNDPRATTLVINIGIVSLAIYLARVFFLLSKSHLRNVEVLEMLALAIELADAKVDGICRLLPAFDLLLEEGGGEVPGGPLVEAIAALREAVSKLSPPETT